MKTKVTILGTESKESKKLKPIEAKYCVQNVLRLGGRFNAAKPLLYEVPTYLR